MTNVNRHHSLTDLVGKRLNTGVYSVQGFESMVELFDLPTTKKLDFNVPTSCTVSEGGKNFWMSLDVNTGTGEIQIFIFSGEQLDQSIEKYIIKRIRKKLENKSLGKTTKLVAGIILKNLKKKTNLLDKIPDEEINTLIGSPLNPLEIELFNEYIDRLIRTKTMINQELYEKFKVKTIGEFRLKFRKLLTDFPECFFNTRCQ